MRLDVLLRRKWNASVADTRAAAAASGSSAASAAQRPGAVIGVGPRQFDRDIHVGELVLDRLERADRPAERIALQRIVARHLQAGIRAAHLLERDQDRRPLQQPLHRANLSATPSFSTSRAGEFDACVVAAGIDASSSVRRVTVAR